jgi:tetratricopeptide (TPR) repeat protein
MPKSLLFGGFITICVVVIVAARMFAPKPAPRPVTAPQQTAAPATPAVSPTSNQGMILAHLKEGKAQMDSGQCDAAIRDHFERILLIDSTHAEAAELKARCEQILANQPTQAASTPADGTTPGATPATAAPGTTAPGTPGSATATPGTRPGSTAKPRTRPDPRATNQNRYALARAALAKGDFLAVKTAANAILQQTPTDKEAQTLLGQAQAGLRESATREVEKGQAAEKEGEWDDAIRAYERARDMDPSVEGANPANAREKRRVAGEDAYNKARQYHSLGRVPEAIAWYERAAKWLPADDARRQTAVTRIAELKK